MLALQLSPKAKLHQFQKLLSSLHTNRRTSLSICATTAITTGLLASYFGHFAPLIFILNVFFSSYNYDFWKAIVLQCYWSRFYFQKCCSSSARVPNSCIAYAH